MANPYLVGNFAPVDREVEACSLEVTGTIPEWLEGRYLRNGPNPTRSQLADADLHWFLGSGMVHGIRLRGEGQSGTGVAG